MFLLFIHLWIFGPANPAFAAEEFYHRIKVPVSARTCEQEALRLAMRFQELRQTPPSSSTCSGISVIESEGLKYEFYNLDLTYSLPLSELSQRVRTSYYGHSVLGSYETNLEGMYPTLKECLRELTMRTTEFESYTHWPVLASTCERDALDYKHDFVLRLDTVGKPEIQLNATEDLADHYSESPLSQAVEKMILANQGQIVAHRKGYFYYYAKTLVVPRIVRFGSMKQNECEKQLEDLQRILIDFHPAEITFACLQQGLPRKRSSQLQAVLNNTIYLPSQRESESYANFAECERDKSRALQRYQKVWNRAKGAICRWADSYRNETNPLYQMEIY